MFWFLFFKNKLKNFVKNCHRLPSSNVIYYKGGDIAEGMYELVFAEESTPLSVWVPVNEEEPYRI